MSGPGERSRPEGAEDPRTAGRRIRGGLGRIRALPAAVGRDVLVLAVIAFFVMVGFGVVVPVLPVFVKDFHVDYVQVGAVVSAFALVRLVSNPFAGWLIRRGGERTVLAVGVGIVALSSALVGVAQSYLQVLVLRGAGGVGSAMFSVSAMTLLLAGAPAQQRGRAVGIYQGGFLIGGMAGPALGGALAVVSLRAPFFFYAATLVVAGLVGMVFLRPAPGAAGRGAGASARDPGASAREQAVQHPAPQHPVPFRQVVRDVRFQAACLANFAQGWAGLGVRSALVPVLIVEVLHRDPVWTGAAFAIAAVVQTVSLGPAGTFVDRVGRRPAIIGSGVLAAVSILGVALAGSLWLLIVFLCVYGVAAAFTGTAPAAAVGDASGGGRGGQAVAVFSMSSDLGAIIGPLVAGFLVDAASYPIAFSSASVLMLASAAFALRMPRAGRQGSLTTRAAS